MLLNLNALFDLVTQIYINDLLSTIFLYWNEYRMCIKVIITIQNKKRQYVIIYNMTSQSRISRSIHSITVCLQEIGADSIFIVKWQHVEFVFQNNGRQRIGCETNKIVKEGFNVPYLFVEANFWLTNFWSYFRYFCWNWLTFSIS